MGAEATGHLHPGWYLGARKASITGHPELGVRERPLPGAEQRVSGCHSQGSLACEAVFEGRGMFASIWDLRTAASASGKAPHKPWVLESGSRGPGRGGRDRAAGLHLWALVPSWGRRRQARAERAGGVGAPRVFLSRRSRSAVSCVRSEETRGEEHGRAEAGGVFPAQKGRHSPSFSFRKIPSRAINHNCGDTFPQMPELVCVSVGQGLPVSP